MAAIQPLQPHQIEEARRVIYITSHDQFHRDLPLEEIIQRYRAEWSLQDLDDYEQRYNQNGGAFLVMVEEGTIIGTGALWRLEEGVGEIRRVWFLPEYQGRGNGYRMMMALLAIAREKGYRKLRLKTQPAFQPRAFEFYKRLGFYEIPNYGHDPDDVGMEMVL